MTAFRYRLRPLSAADTPDALLADILPQGNSSGPLLADGSPKAPWCAVVALLHSLGTRCLLIQTDVRDPDFLEEHQAFYSKQHRPVQSACVRVHAFAAEMPQAGPAVDPDVLSFLDAAMGDPANYLGFVTLRPLRHAPVGATILRPPPSVAPSATDKFPVHIAGNAFEVDGTPFLQQDNAVGACAQASIWMALRTLRRRVGNAAFSPAELTVAATRYLASERTFPGRQGLTANQMLEAVRFAGHDPLHLIVRSGQTPATANAVVAKAHPYTASGLPVIVILLTPHGGHAVLAIGHSSTPARVQPLSRQHNHLNTPITYSVASDWAAGLVIHNDNSGPYLNLQSGDPTARPYCLEQTYSLIVPLPEGVYTSADEAEFLAVRAILLASLWFTIAAGKQPELPQAPYTLRPYLCSRHAFRRWAKEDPDLDGEARDIYRTATLPKTLWIVEIHDANAYDPTDGSKRTRCGEVVLDPAADALHGDALLFVRVTKDLWPAIAAFEALLLVEDTTSMRSIGLKSGSRSAALVDPWRS